MTNFSKRIWSVREVLKHIDHPDRLRDNPLVAWQFRQEIDPRAAVARLKGVLSQSVDRLPARRQQIVRRCDFRGESHQAVMSALALSERHFYRERRAALESIAAALQAAEHAVTDGIREYDSGSADMELCFADTAYQAGDVARALQVLRAASADTEDIKKRIQLESRLAELSCEASALSEAKAHVRESRTLCSQLDDAGERDVTAARIDAVESIVSWRFGGAAHAVDIAKRAVAVLQNAFAVHATVQDAEALGLANLVLAEHDFTRGRPQLGRDRSLQGLDALSLFDTARAVLKMRLRASAATAFMYDARHLKEAAFELEAQYHDALAAGLALEATLIGWRLSNFHRFSQSHRRAVDALRNLLPVARELLPREERAGMCLDLASAFLICGDPLHARGMIAEAQTAALPNGFCAALGPLIAAEACLLEREYDRTIVLSNQGIQAMQRLGRQQSVVNGLRLQAEANFALGNMTHAKNCIGAALEGIDASPHPLVVAKTHRTAARVTGKHKHRRIADEIMRSLRV